MSHIAVIGGSGFSSLPGLEPLGEVCPETPYGQPSAPIQQGRLAGGELLFLSRHGFGHRIPPHAVNYRANLWALKTLGADRVVGLAAVGGIHAAYGPGLLAAPDHLIDYTHGRDQTFHEGGEAGVVHIDFTRPYCEDLRAALLRLAREAGIAMVDGGTHGVTQGPRLETAAEIRRMERDGCDIVGMTGMPEAALARELGLCYASLAFVVNWAAGKTDGEIQFAEIEATMAACVTPIQRILAALVGAGAGGDSFRAPGGMT
jgi:5'-methylthioinosine phosphorylase